MGFWLTLVLFVGFTVLTELLRPKPKFGAPRPSSIGDFQLPTAQEGRTIPVVFGTCKMGGPNVVWYGDLQVVPVTKKVKTGLFSSDRVTVGYRYFLGAQLALCHGVVDEVQAVRFDDRKVPGGEFVVHAGNKQLAFGLVPSDTVNVGTMVEGTYASATLLAQEAQRAIRAVGVGSGWRVIHGFEVVLNVTDQFIYKVRKTDMTFEADTTATISVGKYDAAGYAAALQAAIVATEALIGGGPRVSPTVQFTGSQMRITMSPLRSGYNGWMVRGNTVDYDKTTLPCLGGRMGIDKTIGSLPGVYVAPYVVGPDRFMFAYPAFGAKILTADPAFTAANLMGLDTSVASGTNDYRPNDTWAQVWGVIGYGGANAMDKALRDNYDGTFGVLGAEFGSGDLCGPPNETNVQIEPMEDPGDTNVSFKIRFRGYRGGSDSAGTVTIDLKLFAGSLTREDGGNGTGGTLVATLTANLTYVTWTEHEYQLTAGELTSFRSNLGFERGARFQIKATSGGAGSCLSKSARCSLAGCVVTKPNYKTIQHHRAYRETKPFGILFVDLGSGKVQIDINQPTLFGGIDREGGVKGRIDFYRGTLIQTENDYLRSTLGLVEAPAYRGICYAVLRRPYLGTSPYLKAIAFDIKRVPNQLGLTGGHHDIGGDANPAAILYEILTNDRWGLGLTSAQINSLSFVQAGDLLWVEGFGLSMIFDSSASANELLSEVLRHIDGVLYTDPSNGLITLVLARPNYGPGDPLLLDENNLTSCRISRPSWEDTRNVVKVAYTDRAGNYARRIVQEQDLANVQVRGGEVSEEEFDFRGITSSAIAQRKAATVLKTVSHPLAVLQLEANRTAWRLRPGGMARLTWAGYGIKDMPVRVIRISTGDLKRGAIKIDAVEDVFGVSGTGYLAPGSSGWVDPVVAPPGLAASLLIECPYAMVVGPDRLVLSLGAQATAAQLGYQVWADSSGGSKYALSGDVRELTPSGLLQFDVWYTDTTLRVAAGAGMALLESASDADFAGGQNVLLIGEEFMAWQFISDNGDGTFTLSGVVRGAADSTPARHVGGERVWFVSAGSGFTSPSPYGSDVTVRAKLLAFSPLGVQNLDDVAEISVATNSRALRPYVPTAIKVDGIAYPVMVSAFSDLTVTWSHRNRLAEWSWADAGATAAVESGQTYTLRLYGSDGLLKKTYTGLTGNAQTWDTEIADAGSRQQMVQIELESVVGSLTSFQKLNLTVFRSLAETVRRVDIPIGARQRRRPTQVLNTAE